MSQTADLERYADQALTVAAYQRLEDGSFVGRIPPLKGVIAFGCTENECVLELRSVLEDWVRFRVERGLYVPVINGIDLNAARAQQLTPP